MKHAVGDDAAAQAPLPGVTRRRWVAVALLVTLACAAELTIVWVLMGLTSWDLEVSLAPLHLGAVVASYGAGRIVSREHRLETAALLITATFVPVLGPALAWTIALHGANLAGDSKAAAINAHAHFENLENAETYERNTLTGEYSTDLAREVSAVSYAQILRRGTTQKRRNLLRSLAKIGTRAHVAVIRSCLFDPDPELRLCAHAELDQLARGHESRIAALRETAEAALEVAPPGGPEAAHPWSDLARACHDYAISGVFDAEMSEFWLERAAEYAALAFERAPDDPRTVRDQTTILIALGRVDDAELALETLAIAEESLTDAQLRAEIAFQKRDYETVHRVADRFLAELVPLPAWIEAVTGKRSADVLREPLGAKEPS